MGVGVTSHPNDIFEMKKFFKYFILMLFVALGDLRAEDGLSPQWLKMLYYDKDGAGFVSIVENEDFFIAKDGRYNPKAEYEASVKALNDDKTKKCEMPARFL